MPLPAADARPPVWLFLLFFLQRNISQPRRPLSGRTEANRYHAIIAILSSIMRAATFWPFKAPDPGAGSPQRLTNAPRSARRRDGRPPPAAIRELVLGMGGQTGSTYGPSILYDIENGRPTEGEHIIGDLVRRADRLGVEAPILRAALCNLQIHEARRQARA